MTGYFIISYHEIPPGVVREEDLAGTVSEKRRREKAMTLALVRNVFGMDAEISHTPDGAPFLADHPGTYISLSHSGNRAALAVSADSPVGIDIQDPSPRLRRVAARFLNSSEIPLWAKDDASLLRAWTIKEAVYKAAGIKELLSTEISISDDGMYAVTEHQGITNRYKLEYPFPGLSICTKWNQH